MTAERMTVNQVVQIGTESTPGTGTSANRILEMFNFAFAVEADVKEFRPTGHKYTSEAEENMEWSSVTYDGPMDYNGIIYPASSVFGKATAALVGSSSTVYSWPFIPNLTGASNPQTYIIQQGDAIRAHQVKYGLFTDFSYKVSRKDWTVNGKAISQRLTDGITLTTSPTTVALSPSVANTVSVYLDSTSGSIGSTQLVKVMEVDFNATGFYGPYWTLNASNTSFNSHVDLAPKVGGKILMEADSVGMGLLGYLQTSKTYYLRVQSVGPVIDVPNSLSAQVTHDMAIKVTKPNPYKDDNGVFAIEWDFTVVEDAVWGHSHLFTVQNLISAL